MQLTPIGYAVRCGGEVSAYPKAGLIDICTVARCRPSGSTLLDDGDAVNQFGLCDDPRHALEAARTHDGEGDRRLFAYELLPVIFTDLGERAPLIEAPAVVTPIPATFKRIGYDAVEFLDNGHGGSFGCSPLSCNGMVTAIRQGHEKGLAEAAINEYCLVETLEGALELARYFAKTKPEPGPYAVVAVHQAG